MKIKATCLHVQQYLGNLCIDSGQVTTDELLPPVQEVDAKGNLAWVAKPVHPAGPGHPIHVNTPQIMYRANFTFQNIPLVGDLTLVGITEDKYRQGQEYELEFSIA